MLIAIPLFDGMTTLDAVGPYEVLVRLPGTQVVFVGPEKRAYPQEFPGITLEATATFDEMTAPDIVVVPGGPPEAVGPAAQAGVLPAWLAKVHPQTTYTTSVCTGSILLAAAGLIQGLDSTTHWAGKGILRQMGCNPIQQRVVDHGDSHRILMGAGISSGIDMALTLAARLQGDDIAQGIQLALEYDPQPPFDAGHPSKAPKAVYERVRVELKAVE